MKIPKIYENVQTDSELVGLAKSYGLPMVESDGYKIENLYVKKSHLAKPNSLSSRFGEDAFPFHTDTAFLNIPARLVILQAVSGDFSRPTNLISFNSILKNIDESDINRSVWRCDTGPKKYYTTLFFNELGKRGFRFDPACMIPINQIAKKLHSHIQISCCGKNVKQLQWVANRVIIIPNWLYLHARGSSSSIEKQRLLKRIYIK